MTAISIGDGVRQFQLARQNTSLKTDLSRLSSELSSGQVDDKAKAAKGRTLQLSGIMHSLTVLSGYEQNTRETGQLLGTVQRVLGSIDLQRSSLASDLLVVNRESSPMQLDQSGRRGVEAFDNIIGKMNAGSGGRSLFAGAAVNGPAVASSSDILIALQAATAGDTTADEIITSIDAWFDDPAGFAATSYLGDTGPTISRYLSPSDSISMNFRADGAEFREMLKAVATAAVAGSDPSIGLTTKAELLEASGVALQGAASGMTQLQARVGFAEAEVVRIGVVQTTELTMLSEARNSYVAADPFDAATQLQALQTQLETHYAMTSRLSRLNLTAYL